jgi:hypothetical protein
MSQNHMPAPAKFDAVELGEWDGGLRMGNGGGQSACKSCNGKKTGYGHGRSSGKHLARSYPARH